MNSRNYVFEIKEQNFLFLAVYEFTDLVPKVKVYQLFDLIDIFCLSPKVLSPKNGVQRKIVLRSSVLSEVTYFQA